MQIACFFLRIALIIIGLTFIFGIYTLGIVWPSGWAWGRGHSHYLMMIIGVYATLGVFLIIASRNPYAHKSHLVERGSCGDHGRSIYPRYGRARALSGRCACAHSRCGRPCSADAVDRATAWPRESVPTRLDAGLKIDASADVGTMQTRTHEVVQTFGGV